MINELKHINAFKLLHEGEILYVSARQTLPNATPPVGKIHPFRKIVVPFEPIK